METLQILIVDDHEAVRRGVRFIVSSRPEYSVCAEAADGVEAIDKAKGLRPDVILMDISMPRMDGVEATRIIRQEVPESNIILVSQNDPTLLRAHAAEVGAHGFVSKSNLGKDLLATIGNVVKARNEAKGETGRDAVKQSGWIFGGGTLGRLIAQADWSKTPLGPIQHWPQNLKTAVNLMLNSQHPMWIGWGPEMTFLYNDAYISVLSLAKHPKALGRPASEVWAEIWDVCGPLADKVFQKGEPTFLDDVRLFMSRGDYVEETYYSFSYSPIYDDRGNVAGLFCPSAETTAKLLHARRLHTLSELSSKALMERTIDAACQTCAQTISQNPDDIPFALLYLLSADRSIATLEGSSQIASGLVGVSPWEIPLGPGTYPYQPWPIREVLNTSQSQVVSIRDIDALPLGPAGQRISRALVLPVTSLRQDRPVGILVVGINPTRKLDPEYRTFFSLVADQVATAVQNARAVEEEKQRADALAKLDRAKTVFFSNVSHEFRTPLTLMLGPIEDMLGVSNLSPDVRDRLDVAHRNSLRLLKLVNTLLDFTRLEAGRMQASYELTDLSRLTAELASMFQPVIERAGLRLIVDCPPLNSPIYVDRMMWDKIAQNLLSNAFKFTFDGEIHVSLREVGDLVEFTVRDTGTGIPADEIPHLFERFHRVEGAKGRTFEGSGIGLALVQELTWLHGGSVRAESEPGKGSTFTVSFPVGKDHLPLNLIGSSQPSGNSAPATTYLEEALHWLPGSDKEKEHKSALQASSTSSVRNRILLADDSSDMREYVRKLLASTYDVEEVSDGAAALELARQHPPDLILTDVMMPKLDGFGLLRELRSDPVLENVPVIMLSGRAGEESRVEGLELGADDYLVKPFSSRELLARVGTHLAMAQARSEAASNERNLRAEADVERGRFRELLMQAPAAICLMTGPELRYSFVNQGYLRMTGREHPEDFIGKTLNEALPELATQGFSEILQEVFRTGVPYEGLERKVTLTNNTEGRPIDLYVNFVYQPMRGANHQVNGILVHAVDVSEQVTARKHVEYREQHFRDMIDALPAAIYTTDADGHITHFNHAAVEFAGCVPDLIRDRWCITWKIYSPDGTPVSKDESPMAVTVKTGQSPPRSEFIAERPDGSRAWFVPYPTPFRDEHGRIVGGINMLVDVTDRKRSEEILSQSEERFRKLSESLDAEVRARTSELEERNADIVRQAEQLRDLSRRLLRAQDEERRRIARELHDSAGQTLSVLAMNLTHFVQATDDGAPKLNELASLIQKQVQQLNQEIRTASYLLHPPLLDEAGITAALGWYIDGLRLRSGLDIDLMIQPDFGRVERDLELVIFRIVQECLTNIHRHSGSKTASIQITRDAEAVYVEVEDSGKGISAERMSEIQTRGAGVGLRGLHERVRQFQGDLKIESAGEGTKVTARVPVATESATDTDPAPLKAAV
jgi:PAS domain S-box-containing protein